ncbi:MAG: histidine phosphatase family protein [Synergistales bacterium]|nr:histidine phosphatase family protein [Synergistales bacterium]
MCIRKITEALYVTKKHLYFVRHGKTEWNGQYRFQGKSDIPLNEEGRLQAQSLASRLGGWSGVRILTSPLSRALETSDIIAEACGAVSERQEGLSEMGFGSWEGLSIFETESSDPNAFRDWKHNPFQFIPPGGECFPEIQNRLLPVLDEALSSVQERIFIVSHGGIIRAALSLLLDLSQESVWRMKLSNCSVTAVESGKRGKSLVFLNDDIHTVLPAAILPNLPFPS